MKLMCVCVLYLVLYRGPGVTVWEPLYYKKSLLHLADHVKAGGEEYSKLFPHPVTTTIRKRNGMDGFSKKRNGNILGRSCKKGQLRLTSNVS